MAIAPPSALAQKRMRSMICITATQSDAPASVKARTVGVYWRADPEDMST